MVQKMPKSGKARVLTPEMQEVVFSKIRENRHPEKNMAIMQISFKLGLRVQEIALLEMKEVAQLSPYRKGVSRDFKLLDIMSLPASYTKGANSVIPSKKYYERKTLSFKKVDFDRIIYQVEKLAKADAEIKPEDFYPELRTHKGKSRDLPMVDSELRESLEAHITLRLEKDPSVKPSDPLFISQKGSPYSPNSLQQHMGKMLKYWSGIEKASSHSGRRSLGTDIIHNQAKPLSIAQEVLGHKNASTTVIYSQPTEEQVSQSLNDLYLSENIS